MTVTIILVFITILSFRELSLQADGKLHASFLDVGQGDSIFLQTPLGKQILVDGGPNLSTLEHLGKLMPFFDRSIDYIVLTHPDSDHLTSFPEILERYNIKNILMVGTPKEEPRYKKMLHIAEINNIAIILIKKGMAINTGDGVLLEVIHPSENTKIPLEETNNHSVVLHLRYKNESILLTGDIEKNAEQEILASGIDLSSSILKVPHHGSKTSSSTGFLLEVDPEIAIISSGKDNSFGHPHKSVVDRYKRMGISLLKTTENGTISLEFP